MVASIEAGRGSSKSDPFSPDQLKHDKQIAMVAHAGDSPSTLVEDIYGKSLTGDQEDALEAYILDQTAPDAQGRYELHELEGVEVPLVPGFEANPVYVQRAQPPTDDRR
ncbi:MAG TPA: hypothetical protein VLE99_02240 [Candidatus Saccharimonadales bacterium]|nr:hypothetical protein [Candidatus Saccharimonadales bacterium]